MRLDSVPFSSDRKTPENVKNNRAEGLGLQVRQS